MAGHEHRCRKCYCTLLNFKFGNVLGVSHTPRPQSLHDFGRPKPDILYKQPSLNQLDGTLSEGRPGSPLREPARPAPPDSPPPPATTSVGFRDAAVLPTPRRDAKERAADASEYKYTGPLAEMPSSCSIVIISKTFVVTSIIEYSASALDQAIGALVELQVFIQ
jgi:hypothetical protein